MERNKAQEDLIDLIFLDGNLLFIPEGLDVDIIKAVEDRIKQIQTYKKNE